VSSTGGSEQPARAVQNPVTTVTGIGFIAVSPFETVSIRQNVEGVPWVHDCRVTHRRSSATGSVLLRALILNRGLWAYGSRPADACGCGEPRDVTGAQLAVCGGQALRGRSVTARVGRCRSCGATMYQLGFDLQAGLQFLVEHVAAGAAWVAQTSFCPPRTDHMRNTDASGVSSRYASCDFDVEKTSRRGT